MAIRAAAVGGTPPAAAASFSELKGVTRDGFLGKSHFEVVKEILPIFCKNVVEIFMYL